MNLTTRDDILSRLNRVGRTGPLPRNMDKETAGLIDQMQRQIGELSSALRSVIGSHFNGPQHGSDGYTFAIDARPTSEGYNVLTSAEAVIEGLPADDGFVIYRHATGLLLRQVSVSHWALSDAASPLVSAGSFRVYSYDNQKTVIQLDDAAVTQEVVATIAFFPSQAVPVNYPGRPEGSVPASGKRGQVYIAGDVSPLELG